MISYGMPVLIENQTLEDNVALCARLGLSFVELNMSFPDYQVERLERTDTLISAGEAAGVYYTLHLDEDLNVASFNPLVARAARETVRRAIEATKRLIVLRDHFGDRTQPLTLNMHMNHGIHVTLPDRIVRLYECDFDAYMAAIDSFRAQCEAWIADSPIVISIENTDGYLPFERSAVERLLQSPKFGLTWDIGHSNARGEADMGFIMAHEERLAHFHIHDGTQSPPRDHLALGDGMIPLMERLDTARRHNARCVLETKTIEALGRSIAWLRERGLWEEPAERRRLR